MCLGSYSSVTVWFVIFNIYSKDNFMHECCSNVFLYTYDIKMVGTCTFQILGSLS